MNLTKYFAIVAAGLLAICSSLSAKTENNEIKEVRSKAEKGDAFAQFNLGLAHHIGNGVPKDYTEAAKWYRKAAEQGEPNAQVNLGVLYDQGQGVPKDYTEAVKWHRKAAEQGNDMAQVLLGVAYFFGKGVPKDFVEAYAYFNIVGSKGKEGAGEYLEKLETLMTPSQIEKGQQRTRELLKEFEAKAAGAKAK